MKPVHSVHALLLLTLCPLAAGAGDVIGWRTDGTGTYPNARPPLEWSATKNVLWRTPLKGPGNSLPVPLGHRVFVCSEPSTVVCLHRDDGKILWQKDSSYDELEITPETRKQLAVELEQTKELNRKQSEVNREMDALRRKLKEDKTPNDEIEKQVQPFRKKIEEINKEKQKLTLAVRYTVPGINGTAGYSTPTPVTNGKEVFVAFGSGLVACFDLDGKRKWLKLVEHSNAPFAHAGSPVLAGDRLLIHFTDLVALDTRTGDELWRLKRPTSHGTPLVTRVGGEDVVITPNGALVRASDGKVLADQLGKCGANSPILHDGCVYFVHGNVTAVRLPASLKEPVKVETLWKGKVKGGGYGFASPVIHDGLLYAVNDLGVLSVVEAATGKPVYEERLNYEGSTYPSISAAGGRIHVSSDKGTTVVVQAGREFKELARNQLETFRSSLVFDSKRVYVHTQKHLYCIGE